MLQPATACCSLPQLSRRQIVGVVVVVVALIRLFHDIPQRFRLNLEQRRGGARLAHEHCDVAIALQDLFGGRDARLPVGVRCFSFENSEITHFSSISRKRSSIRNKGSIRLKQAFVCMKCIG
jgi:hypothetical protein